ncbi:hypothetical protein AX14_006601, partial [Amanita brunnescens Koide BX004]
QYKEDTDKIIGYFILKMTSSLQQLHARATNAKTLWDSLATAYTTTGSVAIFNDFTEVTEWRFDDQKDPTISMSELQARLERLTSQGITLPENVKAMILLKAVPKNWDNFARVILATTTASALNITAVLPLIQEEWHRQNPHLAANLSQQQLPQGAQQGQWQTVRGCCRGRRQGRGHRGHGRPYSRPEPVPSGANAPLLPPQQQQWPGQMAGQQRRPNAKRNCAHRREAAAQKKAAKAAGT